MDRISIITLALAKKFTKDTVAALEQVVRYIGVTTTAISDGSTTNPITINGQSVTAVAGDTVFYNGTSYAWDGNAWQEVINIAEIITAVEALGGKVHDILGDIAPEFNSASTYAVDDIVLYEDDLYIFTNAHTGAWDSSDVAVTSIAQLVDDLRAEIASTNGRVSAIETHVTQSGDVIDSDNHSLHIVGEAIETEKTVSGNPITITDALPYPAVSVSAEIEAEQDLHGYDHPWVGGADKNKVETPSATAFAACGITLTTASNGETTLNGTATAGSIDGDTFELPAGTYTISVDTILPSGVWVSLDGVGGAMISPTAKSMSFTTTEAISTFTHIYVNAGVAFNNFKLNWMLESGNTATSFAPYSNICPISGHTSVTITDVDAESNTATVTVQLGTTVYGGTLNVTTGVMTIDHALVDLGSSEWTYQSTWQAWYTNMSNIKRPSGGTVKANIMSDRYETVTLEDVITSHKTGICASNSSDLVAVNNGSSTTPPTGDFCYELATPQTIQLTPEQLTMLKGYNRLSSDGGGDITLTYKANKADSVQAEVDVLDANKAEKTTIAPVENGTKASKAYAVGQHFIRDDKFCTAIAAIASGATLTKNTNYVEGTIAEYLAKKTGSITLESGFTSSTIMVSEKCGVVVVSATIYDNTVEYPSGVYTKIGTLTGVSLPPSEVRFLATAGNGSPLAGVLSTNGNIEIYNYGVAFTTTINIQIMYMV